MWGFFMGIILLIELAAKTQTSSKISQFYELILLHNNIIDYILQKKYCAILHHPRKTKKL